MNLNAVSLAGSREKHSEIPVADRGKCSRRLVHSAAKKLKYLSNRVKEDRVLISKQDLESLVRTAEQNRLMNRVLLNRIRRSAHQASSSLREGFGVTR